MRQEAIDRSATSSVIEIIRADHIPHTHEFGGRDFWSAERCPYPGSRTPGPGKERSARLVLLSYLDPIAQERTRKV